MNTLRQRLTAGWNVSRVLFVLAGGYMIVEALVSDTLPGLIPGLYFLISGLLAFGCAGGNCAVPSGRKKH